MKTLVSQVAQVAAFLLLCPLFVDATDEPSIDSLLKKLPPPEKLVQEPTDRIVLEARALNDDRTIKELVKAIRSKQFQRALDLGRDLANHYPNNATAHFIHGGVAYRLRQYGEATQACDRAIALRANYPGPHLGLGLVELAQNHVAAAIPHFQKLAELEPKEGGPCVLLSACYSRLGQKEKAVVAARHATELSPASAGTWVQLARTEKAAGNTSETLHAILRAADLLPDSAYLLATVGYGYINLNRIPEAIAPLQRAAHFAPNDFLVHAQLGFCLETVGQTNAAMDHLRTAAKLNPNYAPVWEHLGLAYVQQGRHREAVDCFEHATQIMPSYQQAWQHLAQEYQNVGRPADAQRAAARASQLRNASPGKSKKHT